MKGEICKKAIDLADRSINLSFILFLNNYVMLQGASQTIYLRLSISRRSVFECVNLLIIYNRRVIISLAEVEESKSGLSKLAK